LSKQLFLLTDGAVYNIEGIVNEIRCNKQEYLRVHTFGIGSGVSTALIKECARVGNGMFFFID
jgi:hypothetical protein